MQFSYIFLVCILQVPLKIVIPHFFFALTTFPSRLAACKKLWLGVGLSCLLIPPTRPWRSASSNLQPQHSNRQQPLASATGQKKRLCQPLNPTNNGPKCHGDNLSREGKWEAGVWGWPFWLPWREEPVSCFLYLSFIRLYGYIEYNYSSSISSETLITFIRVYQAT